MQVHMDYNINTKSRVKHVKIQYLPVYVLHNLCTSTVDSSLQSFYYINCTC